ncbi:MAG: helix-turn-helix domain-containing protein [Ruminococcus sp.]|nr:helix-turn-helix domain-containing protein [Ruminococcus sp.]
MTNIEQRLARIESLLSIGVKDVLSVKEAAAMLGKSESRIRHLVSSRQIPHYRNDAGRITFLKSELETWLLGSHVPTASEISSLAATHIIKKRI